MLQRDRMNNCREFRSSYGSDKQAFDIFLQNIEQFCQGMQIRCKYKIQVSSFTVGMTWSFNPDIEDITFCLFWYETHILYGQNKALLVPSDNKNLCDFDGAILNVFRLYIWTQIKQTIPFARIMKSQLPCHFNVRAKIHFVLWQNYFFA